MQLFWTFTMNIISVYVYQSRSQSYEAILPAGNACHVHGAAGAISQQSASEHAVRVPAGRVAGAPTASQEAPRAEPRRTHTPTTDTTGLRRLQGKHTKHPNPGHGPPTP